MLFRSVSQSRYGYCFFYPESKTITQTGGTTPVDQVVSNPTNNFEFEFGKFTASPILGTPKTFKYSFANAGTLGNAPKVINGVVIPRYLEISFDITVLTGASKIGEASQGVVGIRNGKTVGIFLKSSS